MKTGEIIKRLKGLQRLDVGVGYDMVSASKDSDGKYVSWYDVEELINQLEESKEENSYIFNYHSSHFLFDMREECVLAEDKKEAIQKFWEGKDMGRWEIISITKNK